MAWGWLGVEQSGWESERGGETGKGGNTHCYLQRQRERERESDIEGERQR